MSAKNQKNLIVVGGVIAALLAGTVLLGGYAKYAPANVESNVAAQGCPGCPMAKGAACGAYFAENTEASASSQVAAAFNPETCPAGRTEPCCAENPPRECCGEPCPLDCPKPCCEPCPPDCPKPCCAEQVEAVGCCQAAAK